MLQTTIQGKAQQLLNIDQDTGIIDVSMPNAKVSMQIDGDVTATNIDALQSQADVVKSGIYTPTPTLVSGTPSTFTVNQHNWLQIGKIVSVSGSISLLTDDTDPFDVALTLPVPSANFTLNTQAAGTAVEVGMGVVGYMQAQVGGAGVLLSGAAADATQQIWAYQFMYEVQ